MAFFDETYGALLKPSWRSRKLGRLTDWPLDRMLRRASTRRKIERAIAACPRQRILVTGVIVPGRESDMERVRVALSSDQHDCDFSFITMQPKGKFDNANDAIAAAPRPIDEYDWLIVTDDDIAVEPGFLDVFIAILVQNGVDLAQPAHRFRSYTSWRVTKRVWGSLLRETRYVEIGPLTAIGRRIMGDLVPFPSTRWCWGLDLYWSHLASEKGWTLGIVDATPLEHLRPVGNMYSDTAAKEEAYRFLAEREAAPDRREIMVPGRLLAGW